MTSTLSAATPVEIDTRLASLYYAEQKLRGDAARLVDRIHRIAGDERATAGRRQYWSLTLVEALERAQKVAEGPTYHANAAADALVVYDAVKSALQTNLDAQAPLHAEYTDRGGWTRAFLVQNTGGHVHSSMNCGTCYADTQFAWMVAYSGKTKDEIIAAAGSDACTVCFPDAPVLTAGRRTMRTEGEDVEQARLADVRAARAAKKAAAAAKAITNPDGTTLRDGHGTRIDKVPAAWQSATGQLADVISDRVHAVIDADRIVEMAATKRANTALIVEALAAKLGQTTDQIMTDLAAKLTAKVKRDAVEGRKYRRADLIAQGYAVEPATAAQRLAEVPTELAAVSAALTATV